MSTGGGRLFQGAGLKVNECSVCVFQYLGSFGPMKLKVGFTLFSIFESLFCNRLLVFLNPRISDYCIVSEYAYFCV